jgi:hypothetical protein
MGDARTATQTGLALDPTFTTHRYRAGASSDNPTYLAQRERIYEGMRMAGVPEDEARYSQAASSSSNALASFRSSVSNPSVNQP